MAKRTIEVGTQVTHRPGHWTDSEGLLQCRGTVQSLDGPWARVLWEVGPAAGLDIDHNVGDLVPLRVSAEMGGAK